MQYFARFLREITKISVEIYTKRDYNKDIKTLQRARRGAAAETRKAMENYNPLLAGNQSPAKFITIGEVMLRLTPPNYEKIRMATSFEASYGGSEANIALALANLGIDSTSSASCQTTPWAKARCVGCVPTMCTAPR